MTNIPAKDVAKALKLSITVGKGVNHDLVSEQLTNVTNRIIGYKSKEKGGLAYVLSDAMAKEAVSGIDFINTLLKAGIPGASNNPDPITGISTNWRPLSPKWIERKRPRSKDLYWKNKGSLALGFGNIANNYKRAIAKHGPLVTTRSRKLIVGKPYRYDIRISLPTHRSAVIQRVLAEAFVNQMYLDGTFEIANYTESVIAYLEGKGRTSRPFIAKVMAGRGLLFKKDLGDKINKTLSSSLWSVKLKT